jgi:hypothetical protein
MNDYGELDETGKSYRRTTRPHAGLRLDVLADATRVQKRPVSSDLSAF